VTVVHTVDIRDRDFGQLLIRDVLQAANIDTKHLPDWRLVTDSKRPDSTDLTEEVLVLAAVKQVFSKHFLAGNQPEVDLSRDRRPEASSATNRAIASKRAL
jgi:hypothetical protein